MTPQLVAMPCHFGVSDELFGMYHAVSGTPSTAVVLCPPLHHELIRCHRIYRQLADALAARGVACLRFDYYGSGDSAGDSSDIDWHRCVADTVAAANELRVRSGCRQLLGFGTRMGAAIAMAACTPAQFSRLVLWDPVTDGAAYVEELDGLQEALRNDPLHFMDPRPMEDAAGQWLGFQTSSAWRQQLTALKPASVMVPVTLLDSMPSAGTACNRPEFGRASVVTLPEPAGWENINRLEHAILSPDLLRAATVAICGESHGT